MMLILFSPNLDNLTKTILSFRMKISNLIFNFDISFLLLYSHPYKLGFLTTLLPNGEEEKRGG